MTVNGSPVTATVDSRDTLLDVIRGPLGLTGTKRGCDEGACGACTVLLDGRPVNSCMILAADAAGCEITTIEGLSIHYGPGRLHPLQQAFAENGAVQCGYCTPGMILSASALLATDADPSRSRVREALSGNLCRCTGYEKIIDAVLDAARSLRKESR
jgi:carbon-monoxide dehydrogenase small subunit